jgi:HAD superfamily hydrolase (TIGR01509 family)
MVKAVIFDIDGTLLDSVDLHAECWQKAFQKFGYHFPFEKIRSQIGKGGDQLLPVFLSEKDLKEKGKAISEYRSQLFMGEYLQKVKPFPCVRELFETVKSHGQKPALASSAKGDELKIFERIAHIEDLVYVGTSSADAKQSKPHPDIFEAALGQLGKDIQPQDVIIVGDSPYDAEAAGKAGVRAIGVLCGGFAESDLRAAGCIAIFRDPEDLWKRYEDSPLAPNR